MKPCNFPNRINERRKRALVRMINTKPKTEEKVIRLAMCIQDTEAKIVGGDLKSVKSKKARTDKRRLW